MSGDAPWWRGATIYQIYPRSFVDSNGDGVGDLPGITAALPHVAALNVDAIWLSPFYKSPMLDFGYDVSDFCDVDPVFGTLADFDRLVSRAHELGLRVIVDQIYSHSSDQHPWFRESRASRDNPRADWYVWADPKPDGSTPNNWQSLFGGPAWHWDARRRQYYLHNFLPAQPDLNVHNPAVQAALLDVARFWLKRGVDGFRLDAINYAMHDPGLRDNPPAPDRGTVRTRPSDFQLPIHNQGHPLLLDFIRSIRRLTEEHGGKFTVAEVGGLDALPAMKMLIQGTDRLHSAYGFDFLYADRLTPALVRSVLEAWPSHGDALWPSWAFSNHDAPRAVSRWAAPEHRDAFARLAMLLLISLRGNVFLYYGEELGLPQASIDFEDLQDPEAIANWPLTLGRDGARTPMPWRGDDPFGGFSTCLPWLPVVPEQLALNVSDQQRQPGSMLAWTRQLMALRKTNMALREGDLQVLEAGDALLVIERRTATQQLRCVFNLASAPLPRPASAPTTWRTLAQTGNPQAVLLPGFSGLILEKTP